MSSSVFTFDPSHYVPFIKINNYRLDMLAVALGKKRLEKEEGDDALAANMGEG